MKKYKIFSGTASQALAKKVAKDLDTELGRVEIIRFSDGECRVRVEEELGGKVIFIIQSLCPPVDENLVELCLLADTLNRNGAQRLVGIIPYLGYARQDKIHRKGECLSSQLIAKILEGVGFASILTFDVHSQRALGFFKIPAVNISAVPCFIPKLKGKAELMVVAPDKGAVGYAQNIAKELKAPCGYFEKDRDLITGKVKIKGVKGDVAGKEVVIIDDMIASGGTMVLISEFLARAKAKGILICATHPLLVKEASSLLQRGPVEQVMVTDTIPVPKEKEFKKLEVVSVSSLIAKAIEDNI